MVAAMASRSAGPARSGARFIAATKDYPGVTGVITIDQDHNAVKPAVVLKVEKGSAHYVTTVKP